MQKMMEVIEPSCVLVYGGALEFDYGDTEVKCFDNDVLKRWKANDKA